MITPEQRIAVIAGGDYARLTQDIEFVDTDYSVNPVALTHVELAGKDVLFAARHDNLQIPSFVDSRAIVQALKKRGANRVITVSRSGRMAEHVHIGNLVNIDHVVYHSLGNRPTTFSVDGELMIHAPTFDPYNPHLRDIMNLAWQKAAPRVAEIYRDTNLEPQFHPEGVFFNSDPPWFNNRKQEEGIRIQWPDVAVIGQTQLPENSLLRELGMITAGIAICTDNASYPGERPGSHAGEEGVLFVSEYTSRAAFELIGEMIALLPEDYSDVYNEAMRWSIAPHQVNMPKLKQSHPILAGIIMDDFGPEAFEHQFQQI